MKIRKIYTNLCLSVILGLTISGATYSQKLDTYTSLNGFNFTVGDTLMLGVGSASDGRFKYIYESVARTIFATLADEYDYDFRLPDYFHGAPVVIKKIKSKNDETLFYFDTDGWGAFVIDIEKAIAACEVAYCRPYGFLSQEEFEKLILLYRAVLDNKINEERFWELRNEMLE